MKELSIGTVIRNTRTGFTVRVMKIDKHGRYRLAGVTMRSKGRRYFSAEELEAAGYRPERKHESDD